MAQSTVRLIVDAQNAIRPLQRVNEQTKALSKSTDKLKGRLDKSSKSFKNTGKSAKEASKGVKTFANALSPLIKALAIAATARFVFVKTAELETQRKSLEVLTGSLEKTNKIIEELQQFSAITPFTSSELIDQTKRLKAFGFETEELVDTTRRLAEVAGATGADLQGIATAFGQIRAKGKLQQEENLQLLERGVDITTELKRITGLQGDAFEKAQRQGKIGADLVNQALINLTNEGGKFFGGATLQAETLNGQLSTLKDNVEKLAVAIGDFLGPILKRVFKEANRVLDAINRLISSEFQRDISKLRFQLQIAGGTKKDLENIKNFVDSIPTQGIDLISVDTIQSQLQGTSNKLKEVASEISRQRPFGLTRKEIKAFENAQKSILDKIQELEKVRKRILNDNKKNEKITKEIKKDTEGTTIAFTGLVPITQTFKDALGQSDSFLDAINGSAFQLSEGIFEITSEADQLKEKFMEIGQGIEDGIVSGLTDAVMGTKTLAEAATSVLNNLKRKLVEVAIQRAVSGIGNFFGNALSGIFGGGKKSSSFSGFPNAFNTSFDTGLLGFANGGRPPVGKASLVGEKGPEIFVPRAAGTIIPNDKIGGGVTNVVTVNVDASGSAVSGNNADATVLGQVIGQAVQAQLIKEKRAGGLLTR